jgi:3,4-dihydroxy 2-butanone 4-phosphate synthase/GTP cyclohydrolase II
MCCIYRDKAHGSEHIALIKGDIGSVSGAVPVRMHRLDIAADALGCGDPVLESAMREIEVSGQGAIVIFNHNSLESRLSGAGNARHGDQSSDDLRDYGIGAQILLDLGIQKIELLTNHPKNMIALDGYGLEVAGTRPVCCQEETRDGQQQSHIV